MQYKTIILELLQQQPKRHEQLRKQRKLLTVTNSLAQDLKARHEAWKRHLIETQPDMDTSQVTSAALEIALKEIEEHMQLALPADPPTED